MKRSNNKKSVKRKDFEIGFYESLIKKRPNFVQALISLGNAYTRKGFYREGLAVDRKLVQLRPEDPEIRYNLACSLSLTKDVKQAFAELKNAVLLGYDEFAYILRDSDLKNLRRHSNFKKFLAKIERLKQ